MEARKYRPQGDSVLSQLDRVSRLPEREQEREIDRFVRERVALLMERAPRVTFGFPDKTVVRGFLHPESLIRVHKNHQTIGIRVDDDQPYRECVKEAVRTKQVPLAVQRSIDAYFGTVSSTEKSAAHDRRVAFYTSRLDGPTPSIRELRDRKTALCVERAALAQNLVTVLGNDSALFWAPVRYRDEEGNHAFNAVTTVDGRHVLYDPNNPIETYDASGVVVETTPGAYPISAAQFEDLLRGRQVVVARPERRRAADGSETEVRNSFVYFPN